MYPAHTSRRRPPPPRSGQSTQLHGVRVPPAAYTPPASTRNLALNGVTNASVLQASCGKFAGRFLSKLAATGRPPSPALLADALAAAGKPGKRGGAAVAHRGGGGRGDSGCGGVGAAPLCGEPEDGASCAGAGVADRGAARGAARSARVHGEAAADADGVSVYPSAATAAAAADGASVTTEGGGGGGDAAAASAASAAASGLVGGAPESGSGDATVATAAMDSASFAAVLVDPPRDGLDETTLRLVARFPHILVRFGGGGSPVDELYALGGRWGGGVVG